MVFPAKSSLAALLGILGVAGVAHAQDISESAGTAEFQFLDILVQARPAGLAGAYTSLAQGEDAVGYNPAGVSKAEAVRSVSATGRYHQMGVSSGNVTYAFPGGSGIRCAFSAAYVNYGRIEGLDEDGLPTGETHMPASFAPSFTAAAKVSEKVRVGATVKGVSEYLGDFEESRMGLGWGLDAGLQFQPSARNLGFGLALLNFGNKLASQLEHGEVGGMLPVSVKGGMYYHPLDLPKGRLALDLEWPWYDAPLVSGGFEYAYLPSFALRAGTRLSFAELKHYFLKATDQRPGEFDGGNALKLAGGFTFQAEGIGLDYALQYWHGLSFVHALTMRYAVL